MSRANPLTTHNNAGIAARGNIIEKTPIHSYQDAEAFLDGDVEKQVAANVYVHRIDLHTIGVKLYNTTIIKYHPDDTFEADNQGYNSPTTSTRARQFGPKGWGFWHHRKVLHGLHVNTMSQERKEYRHGAPMHFGERWSIHGVPHYAVCEPYNVRETSGDDYPDLAPDAYEYTATLFDQKGNELDSWDSINEGYSSTGQTLTQEQAESSCKEITDDVRAGKASQWFSLPK